MKAVAGQLPPDDGRWGFEIKWDGMRAVAYVGDGDVRLRTTRRNDVAAGYPELDGLAAAVRGRPAVLDGEVVAFDDHGVPSFSRMQERMHVLDRPSALRRAERVPAVYVCFDLLHLDGLASWRLPYADRRRILRDLFEDGPHWQAPAHRVGGGSSLLEAAAARELEGVMAKLLDAPYEPGRRSPTWRKVKVRHAREFVVGGWLPGSGRREGRIGALMLGCHGDAAGALRWVGNVGTGFTERELDRLAGRLRAAATCRFSPRPVGPAARFAHWVEPELVVQVAFGEWTPEGRLRHPAYLGERTDKDPADVTCTE